MLDFFRISTRPTKRGVIEIYPKFIVEKSSDLMIRGGDFYAVWIDELKLWSTDEIDALRLIDKELDIFAEENKSKFEGNVRILHMWDAESGMIDKWHRYCQKQLPDSFHMLDEKLIFSNTKTTKRDYASKKLSYPLEEGDFEAYEKLVSTLYSEDERRKIEWAIGAVISGDSKKLQKFAVLYGAAGTGKSTILNIIQKLFEGYYSVFDAKSLGSSNNSFALEAFKSNPLVAIQHDGDLSRIEDNTRLNSLVSHELMTVNEKFKSTYANRFNCFLFMGTNKPVRITDAKSGLLRRLIDISPSGNKVPVREYNALMKRIDFELGAIADHCLKVYLDHKDIYDTYIPVAMLGASNDFYNFIGDSYFVFAKENGVTLKAAWEMYKTYCEEARVAYPYSQRIFREELKNYFEEFKERFTLDDGTRVRSYYYGFRADKFENKEESGEETESYVINFSSQKSIFDEVCAGYPAQYATEEGKPLVKWDNVKTTLSDIDTSKVHYILPPGNIVGIDFDIPGKDGKKDYKKNLEAASKWPPTYAELSKSGAGIHLYYIYTGDVSKLEHVYDDHIEIKVFTGKASLRRKLTKCNDLPIATISSGLPLKGEEKKVVNQEVIKSEKNLRKLLVRALNKEIHPNTKPSIDFMVKVLDDAYNSGLKYDVTDMKSTIMAFAFNSTNQSAKCLAQVATMKFKSEDASDAVESKSDKIVFYDIEIFPNMSLVCYKFQGEKNKVVPMLNPTPIDIEKLLKYRLIGFNCRRYDNHILYGMLMGYSNEQLYKLSMRIINGDKDAFFREAYNLSYTDIYDFASAGNKKSLKKLEIEMGIHHQELGLPFDKPVEEALWKEVVEYCGNDVIATEAAFDYLKADWNARQILADLAGMTVNDTTNTLTTKFIFGLEKNPQTQFNYRDLSKPVNDIPPEEREFLEKACPSMMGHMFKPPSGGKLSVLPYFPGYSFERIGKGKSTYRGEVVGEGGYVYAEPGMYGNVALLDIASMHPHSVIAECLFGTKFTEAFRDIVEGRVSIKHEAWDVVNGMLDGKLAPYVEKVQNGEMTSKDLANALKTAINSVYGLTSASFSNAFKDSRNIDNIVAKRGALFMIDLKHEVQKRGFTVAHIKTDSIKIPDATPEIIQFVMDFGEKYGYSFEHEATYDRMCLVNDAVYIAKDAKDGHWTATGTQFQVPYVFKTLFSKEPITFDDLCETKSVKSSLYLDMNENLPDVSEYEKKLSKLETKFKKGEMSDTTFEKETIDILPEIEKGHNYKFIGRVGQFCPMKPGSNGGLLMRYDNGKYYAVTGTKGYRWQESEVVRTLGKEDCVDKGYYISLVNDAVETLISYGNYEWFVSDDPYIGPEFVNGKPVYKDNKKY